MSYFAAPIWDDEKCPNTDDCAVPKESEAVKGRRVIQVERATYRNAEFGGTFLLSKTVVLPLPKEGKHKVKVECCWFGHRLKEDEPTFLVDMATANVDENYDGEVCANLGRLNT